MRIRVLNNPKNDEGFSLFFPYAPSDVEKMRKVLGATWDKPLKAWLTEGPEVLLDFQRFGIQIEWISKEARELAEEFRQQLWDSMDCRLLSIDDEMYGYQVQGAKFLSLMPNVILGDDMGTGKSKQSLDAASLVSAKSILVLCPKTLAYNWKAEVERWHPEFTVGVVPDLTVRGAKHKPGKFYRDEFWNNPPNVVIANYEKLRLADWPYATEWDVLICDEATKLKNSSTQVYKNVKRIVKRAARTWALTGTPLELRLMELFNIMGLLRPAVLGSFQRFRVQHLETDWYGNIVGSKNLSLLRERIGPFMLRRTKQEVLRQLPAKVYQNVFVELSAKETAAYQAMTATFNNWLTEHHVSGKGDGMVEMLRMRQFCCTPDLFTQELGRGAKFETLQEIVEEWPGRVLIFCFFEEVTRRLHEWLGCHPEAIISGKVPNDLRIPRVNAFNKGELGKIMVSTDAGGMGLNITGADLVIHYDQLFNPQRMHQREDRLHRIGQTNNVTVINLLCIDTIDYGMYQLNQEREKLFEEVIDGAEEALLRKLDAPRLRRLVEGRLNNERKRNDE